MDEKDLFRQLNKIKFTKPNAEWKKANRDILVSQVYGPEADKFSTEFNFQKLFIKMLPAQIFQSIAQPVMAVFLILLVICGGGFFSIKAAKNSKPGDSLYIAKIVNEKTQLALTFDEKNKAQLELSFAGNRANEITQVLAEQNEPAEQKEEKVDKLIENFNKEIAKVKGRVIKISNQNEIVIAKNPAAKIEPVKSEGENAPAAKEEDSAVFSANSGKDNAGINYAENNQAIKLNTTSTPPLKLDAPAPSLEGEKSNPKNILEEAQFLINTNNYTQALNVLNKAEEAVNEIKNTVPEKATSTPADGKVLGVEENADNASSTD